ncbi:MAG TPA: hypothetical protein VLH94_04445 [Spirochaetia bacterium]|nr:hypothetical protein [Spirochaetia bacterium]
MIIEFQNTIEPKNHSTMAMAIVITACALFFIPTTLIVLGYYSSQPTGTLISPLPQGTLSKQTTPTPTQAQAIVPSVTPTIVPDNQPIIADANTATDAANTEVASAVNSNIIDKTASIEANTKETIVKDAAVQENSQIYLSPRPGDKAIYSLRSKTAGQFTIVVSDASDTLRYIDYSIVNP